MCQISDTSRLLITKTAHPVQLLRKLRLPKEPSTTSPTRRPSVCCDRNWVRVRWCENKRIFYLKKHYIFLGVYKKFEFKYYRLLIWIVQIELLLVNCFVSFVWGKIEQERLMLILKCMPFLGEPTYCSYCTQGYYSPSAVRLRIPMAASGRTTINCD